MPYESITDLPASVRDRLSEQQQRQWRRVFNEVLERTGNEGRAMASANAAVNKADTYKLPEAARNNARKVLRWREEHGDDVEGMTGTGWRRARQLADNESVGIETVRAMSAFNRHRKNSEVAAEHKNEPWKDAGYVAWLGWGGTSGIDWARGITGATEKRALSDDVFTEPMEAVQRAMALGMQPAAHVHEMESGQAVYMPGATHKDYVDRMAEIGGQIVNDEGEEVDEDNLLSALAALFASVSKRNQDRVEGAILKADDEQRIVYGWASISSVNGEMITDKQGDRIAPQTMEKAATRFMESARMAKAMHEGGKVGEVVHSLPLTKEIGQRLGIHSPIEGWVVAIKISDNDVWKRVKSGELRAFSIGGRGKRSAV